MSVLVAALAVAPFYVSGNDLMTECQSSDAMLQLSCARYVEGVIDSQTILEDLNQRPWFCVPKGVTAKQASDVLVKGMENEPQNRQFPAATLVAGYFARVWKCPQPNNAPAVSSGAH